MFIVLPKTEGWLPKWQLVVASLAIFNTVQNFTTLKLTRRLYNAVPTTYGMLCVRRGLCGTDAEILQ